MTQGGVLVRQSLSESGWPADMCSRWLDQVLSTGGHKELPAPQHCHRYTVRKVPQATMIRIPKLENLSLDGGAQGGPQGKDVSWLQGERKDSRVPKLPIGNWRWTGFKGVPGCQMFGVISVYKAPDELAAGLSIGHLRLKKREMGTYSANCPNHGLELCNIAQPTQDSTCVLDSTRGERRAMDTNGTHTGPRRELPTSSLTNTGQGDVTAPRPTCYHTQPAATCSRSASGGRPGRDVGCYATSIRRTHSDSPHCPSR